MLQTVGMIYAFLGFIVMAAGFIGGIAVLSLISTARPWQWIIAAVGAVILGLPMMAASDLITLILNIAGDVHSITTIMMEDES